MPTLTLALVLASSRGQRLPLLELQLRILDTFTNNKAYISTTLKDGFWFFGIEHWNPSSQILYVVWSFLLKYWKNELYSSILYPARNGCIYSEENALLMGGVRIVVAERITSSENALGGLVCTKRVHFYPLALKGASTFSNIPIKHSVCQVQQTANRDFSSNLQRQC